MDLII